MDSIIMEKREIISARIVDLYRRNTYFLDHLAVTTAGAADLKSKLSKKFEHIVDQAIHEYLPAAKPATQKEMKRVMLAMFHKEAVGERTTLGQTDKQPQLA